MTLEFISCWFRKIIWLAALTAAQTVWSQTAPDSSGRLNMDAVYNRPFLELGRLPVALGGYVEANTAWFSEDGMSEGLSFQLPRLTLFASSTISRNIKFLTEIEFEEGGREINIEFASLDIKFLPALQLRGGVVMNPIGAFNQNHDGPKWEFVDRPIAATQLLPATWSNVGFGLHGKFFHGPWTLGYEAYLTNGFDPTIIDNAEGKTFLPASKISGERFEESLTGRPLYSGKLAVRHRLAGEIGLSYMGGAYNREQEDGLQVDALRRVHVFAVDFNASLPGAGTAFTGEWAWIRLNVPENYAPQYGSRQQGGFLDVVQPFFRGQLLHWQNAVLNLAVRLEYVDWNVGRFAETGTEKGDALFALSGGLSFRPSAQTVLRLNYRYSWQEDLFGNPPGRAAGWLFGLSSYF